MRRAMQGALRRAHDTFDGSRHAVTERLRNAVWQKVFAENPASFDASIDASGRHPEPLNKQSGHGYAPSATTDRTRQGALAVESLCIRPLPPDDNARR